MGGLASPLAQVEFFKRGQDAQLSPHFHLREFECKCGVCPYTLISVQHVLELQGLRNLLNKPVKILSAYRCPKHNDLVGGEKNSMHMYGLATDISVAGLAPEEILAAAKIFDGVGIYDTFVHVDSRGFTAFWARRTK